MKPDQQPDPQFAVDPWQVKELSLDTDRLAQAESVFALSNGHIGVRGNLDEGDPSGLPGTYLNSFCEEQPLPYAEAGYGYPEQGQTIVNVTNGKIIRLLIDDQPFDLRYGVLRQHERTLDLRSGLLHRDVLWESPSGRQVRVRSTRMVSFTQRAILAIQYRVEAVDQPLRVVAQSELVANEEMPTSTRKDPRAAAALTAPLVAEEHGATGLRSILVHRTRVSNLRMAASCDHLITGVDGSEPHTFVQPDWSRTTAGTQLAPGQSLEITKFVAYGWSSRRTLPALRDQVDAALSSVLTTGWDNLVAEQRSYLDEYWDGADVEIDGDPSVQQAVRFGLFHVLQAGARAEGRPIPAKGLTGPGYDGHSFWDSESYVLPVLNATAPIASRDALLWRYEILDQARDRAKTLRLSGASFPWRTIRGQECSGYWLAGTAALHINADIAVAAQRYMNWNLDDQFATAAALPLQVETARLWADYGFTGDDGKFHICGVTGPDEYSALVDDNVYTNLMAARNLRFAADNSQRWPEQAAKLNVTDSEIALWRSASESMAVPFDSKRDVVASDRGSTDHDRWDFAETDRLGGLYPLMLHYPYLEIYPHQVIKQADLVMAMIWCGDQFTIEEKAKAFAFTEEITVRDSSLSACMQAILAAEVGHRELARDYLSEAALMDLHDLASNTRDGVHVASLAGAWLAVVYGFGGMRDWMGKLSFAPALPQQINRLAFTVRWQGHKISVQINADHAVYELSGGNDARVELTHYGQAQVLKSGAPLSLPIHPQESLTPRPTQPIGREPRATPDHL